MGLCEKSKENKQVVMKCLTMKTYNAGISRAYYTVFQMVEYELKKSIRFDYKAFIDDNKIKGSHIPHGKMQQEMVKFMVANKKMANLAKVSMYDNLYRMRRKADYTDTMCNESDLKQSIVEMNTLLKIIGP